MGIDQPDGISLRLELVQDDDELTARDEGIDIIVAKLRKAISCAGGLAQCRAVAETHATFRGEACLLVGVDKTPIARQPRVAQRKGQALVSVQLFRSFRTPIFLEVPRSADNAEVRFS